MGFLYMGLCFVFDWLCILFILTYLRLMQHLNGMFGIKKTCSKANEYKYLVVGSFGPLKGPKSLQKEVDYENFNILAW